MFKPESCEKKMQEKIRALYRIKLQFSYSGEIIPTVKYLKLFIHSCFFLHYNFTMAPDATIGTAVRLVDGLLLAFVALWSKLPRLDVKKTTRSFKRMQGTSWTILLLFESNVLSTYHVCLGLMFGIHRFVIRSVSRIVSVSPLSVVFSDNVE